MNIWFMVWVFVAVFILGTSLWSLYILLKQKRSWEAFAKKNDMEFISTAFMKSPMLRGAFEGVKVMIYSDQQIAGHERQKRIRTVFEFALKAPMPTEGAIASAAFKNFVNGLGMAEKYVPDSPEWNKEIVVSVTSGEAIAQYFTKERIGALSTVMTIKNCPVMILFSNEDTVMRVESADPFDKPDKLERFLKKMTDAVKIISL